MSSTQAGYGDEFVPTDLASNVLANVDRTETSLWSKLAPAINMPTNPYKFPVE
jgi:hypothetical protein